MQAWRQEKKVREQVQQHVLDKSQQLDDALARATTAENALSDAEAEASLCSSA